jgi:hypothetical protein
MNDVRIRPLRGRMIFAVLTLGLCALYGLATGVLSLIRPGFMADGQIDLMVLAATGLAFVSWLFEARTNLEGVEPRLRWHPIWSHTGWLIPLASLVIPLLVVREIDRATQQLANGTDRSGLFATWACSWTIFQLAWIVPSGGVTKMAVVVIEVVAAVAAIMLVLRITEQQEAVASLHLVRATSTG